MVCEVFGPNGAMEYGPSIAAFWSPITSLGKGSAWMHLADRGQDAWRDQIEALDVMA